MSFARQEQIDRGFTALPTGWYNYYNSEGKVYCTSCPGLLKVETVNHYTDGRKEHGAFEYKATEFDGGLIIEAESLGYIGTFADKVWEETTNPLEMEDTK
ncbi:hypothetical protein PSET11_03049 [Arthrobacter ulcerisalmonis]|uniref:Uncharacterized protein n=1 Tax=Arthrobacter ulcerisalmonis TaxID=2483813 RepID=A0A3P5XTD7_9MICC|nr:hypothetical protein [Arthrobacter ulcerisalmonis]VDC32297.1 hypothetical protein PSET11_03049 [Arthrobacter ulcerisalmonis]